MKHVVSVWTRWHPGDPGVSTFPQLLSGSEFPTLQTPLWFRSGHSRASARCQVSAEGLVRRTGMNLPSCQRQSSIRGLLCLLCPLPWLCVAGGSGWEKNQGRMQAEGEKFCRVLSPCPLPLASAWLLILALILGPASLWSEFDLQPV